MASAVTLKKFTGVRSFDELVTDMTTFIATLTALDVVYTSQIIQGAGKPKLYWSAVIIWFNETV